MAGIQGTKQASTVRLYPRSTDRPSLLSSVSLGPRPLRPIALAGSKWLAKLLPRREIHWPQRPGANDMHVLLETPSAAVFNR